MIKKLTVAEIEQRRERVEFSLLTVQEVDKWCENMGMSVFARDPLHQAAREIETWLAITADLKVEVESEDNERQYTGIPGQWDNCKCGFCTR